MLVATPGQTTAYTLPTTASTTKKPPPTTSVNTSSSSGINNSNNNTHNASTSSNAATATPSTNSTAGNSIKSLNNFNFHTPSHNNINSTTIKSSKDTNNQHSLKISDNSKSTSFISNLKGTVQKAASLVSTAASLSRNCNQINTAAIKTNNSTTSSNSSSNYINNNTSKSTIATSLSTSSLNVISSAASSSSSSLVAITKNSNSSATTINTSASTSSSASTTFLPLSVGRKKFPQSAAVTQPKLHTIPPTILHRYPEERQYASSTDSFQKEMCHFKPIRTAPTTPWKSGSKSRGSSLRFPKANLATKKTEFILKSNCDVNNRTKRKPQAKLNRNEIDTSDNDGNGDDNNDEQENKEYFERFKPKPSTLQLSSIFETPSHHQSAFVCLVAQMKNLINIQPPSSKTLTSSSLGKGGCGGGGGDSMNLHKTKSSTRITRTKYAGNVAKSIAVAINETVKDSVGRSKKFKSPAPPPPIAATVKKSDLVRDVITTRSCRSAFKTPETSVEVSKKIAKTNELTAKVTKAKTRSKVKGAKTAMMTQMIKASPPQVKEESQISPPTIQHDIKFSEPQGGRRKRKATALDIRPITVTAKMQQVAVPPTPSISLRSSTARACKYARRTSNSMAPSTKMIFKYPEINFKTENNQQRPQQTTQSCFSPPLTRARLKYLLSLQQTTNKPTLFTPLVDVKKRKG